LHSLVVVFDAILTNVEWLLGLPEKKFSDLKQRRHEVF
jgi:hypothetical protein